MTTPIETRDKELKEIVEKIDWGKFVSFGSIKFQIRDGKVGLTTIEHTIKID